MIGIDRLPVPVCRFGVKVSPRPRIAPPPVGKEMISAGCRAGSPTTSYRVLVDIAMSMPPCMRTLRPTSVLMSGHYCAATGLSPEFVELKEGVRSAGATSDPIPDRTG